MVVRTLVVAWFVWLSSSASVARANDVVLNWQRGPHAQLCIAAEEIRSRLEQRFTDLKLESEPLGGQGGITLRGRVEGRARQWHATLSLQNADGENVGERQIQSAARNCRELDDALALVAMLLLEPLLIHEPAPAGSSLTLSEEEDASVVSTVPDLISTNPSIAPNVSNVASPGAVVPSVPAARAMRSELSAGLAVAWRGTPQPVLGLDVSVALLPLQVVALELGGTFYPSRRFAFGDVSTRTTFGQARVDACPGVTLGRARFDVCLGVDLGFIRAEAEPSVGIRARQKRRMQIGGHGAARVQMELAPRTTLRVSAYASRFLGRDRFGIAESPSQFTALYETPPLVLTLFMGIVVQLR